ncbi:MAG: alpha/beta hydrolase [Cyclobacteriaceae bacterium]|nr:alpha/beta hydrolase [Cyclobacteriaceae bacterium]
MNKVIIGIHGLGNKPPRRTEVRWWKAAMIEGLKRIGKTPWLPDFELVYWADLIYEKPLDTSVQNPEDKLYLEEPYIPGAAQLAPPENHEFRKKVMEFVEHRLDGILLNEDFTINYSALTDKIMRRYFTDLVAYYSDNLSHADVSIVSVRERIRHRLVEIVQKYQGREIILIGHSMGSIIAYDVLTFLIPRATISQFITIGSPLGFPVVQGRIASEWKQAGMEIRRLKSPPGITGKWINFADLRDRVAIVWQLAKNYSPNAYGVSPEDKVVVNNYSNGKAENAHKSYGYLRTEEFSTALSGFIGEVPVYKKSLAAILHGF